MRSQLAIRSVVVTVAVAFFSVCAHGSLAHPGVADASSSTYPILVMGDSYSAGNGAGEYEGPPDCWQSPKNYAGLYSQALNQPPYDQLSYVATSACSGDTTSSFFSKTHNRSRQLDSVKKNYDLIFLTIGGDDVHFARVVRHCLIQATRDGVNCNADLSGAEKLLTNGTLEARIRNVLREIRKRANPQATIALLGYPYLESNLTYRLPYGHNKFVAVGKWLRAIEDKGDAIQQRVVSQLDTDQHTTSFVFVNTTKLFAGHELSATDSNPDRWFVEPLTDSISHETWYHPNPKGWAEEASLLLRDPGIPKPNISVSPANVPTTPSQPTAPAPSSAPPSEEPGVVSFPGSPLTVSVGQLGQCQSSYEGSSGNYFLPESSIGDCGFFLAFPATGAGQPLALQGSTWGFEGAAGPHDIALYTPVSQSPITGSGTGSDPYTETTVFKLLDYEGSEDALITETTTYVNGATQFTSTYSVKNTTAGPIYFRAIYGGDLYIGGDDFGVGFFEDGSSRFVGGQNVENGAIGGFQETTGLPWSAFEEGCWNDTSEEDDAEADAEADERCAGAEDSDYGIWHILETSAEEPRAFNELTEPADVDNAVGVEWDQVREAGLQPGQEQAFSIVNAYRP